MTVDKVPGAKVKVPARDLGAPPTTTSTTTLPPASTSAPPPSTTVALPDDGARKQLALSTDKAPASTSITASTNARNALLHHVQDARDGSGFTVEQRKFLRTAAKELAKPGTNLEAHVALRELAAELGVRGAFDEILRSHASALLPELLEKATVFAGAPALRALGELATAMDERATFDVHLAEQLTLAKGWAKTDGERSDVEALSRALGLSITPADAPAPARTTRTITEDFAAVRKSRRLITKNPIAWAGYQKILELLANGEAGKNQHALSREYAGMWAADLPGTGSGRGAERVIYEIVDDKVIVRDITDYH